MCLLHSSTMNLNIWWNSNTFIPFRNKENKCSIFLCCWMRRTLNIFLPNGFCWRTQNRRHARVPGEYTCLIYWWLNWTSNAHWQLKEVGLLKTGSSSNVRLLDEKGRWSREKLPYIIYEWAFVVEWISSEWPMVRLIGTQTVSLSVGLEIW